MVSASRIEAGRAAVRLMLDRSAIEAGLKAVQRRFDNFGKFVNKVGGNLKNFGSSIAKIGATSFAGFAGASGVLFKIASQAGDLTEEIGQLDAVFGSASSEAEMFAKKMAADIGRGVNDTRRQVITLGASFKGAGFNDQDAAQLVKRAQTVAADLASAFGKGDTQAGAEAVAAALTGERERLKQLQVFIKESDVAAELGNLGFDPKTATNAQKALATLELIEKKSAQLGATNNARDTKDSFANQVEAIKGQVADLTATLGGPFATAIAPMLTSISDVVKRVTEWAKANPELVAQLGKFIVVGGAMAAGVTAIGTAIAGAGFVISGVGAVISSVAAVIGAIGVPIGLAIAVIGTLIAAFVDFEAVAKSAMAFFKTAIGDTEATVSGIKDAIMTGDISLAWEIVMEKSKAIILRALAEITDGFTDLFDWLPDMITDRMGIAAKNMRGGAELLEASVAGLAQSAANQREMQRREREREESDRALTEEHKRRRAAEQNQGFDRASYMARLQKATSDAGRTADMEVQPTLDASESLDAIKSELDNAVDQSRRSFDLALGDARFDSSLMAELSGSRIPKDTLAIQKRMDKKLAMLVKKTKKTKVMSKPAGT